MKTGEFEADLDVLQDVIYKYHKGSREDKHLGLSLKGTSRRKDK